MNLITPALQARSQSDDAKTKDDDLVKSVAGLIGLSVLGLFFLTDKAPQLIVGFIVLLFGSLAAYIFGKKWLRERKRVGFLNRLAKLSQDAPPPSSAAGFYDDPLDPLRLRWWDGMGWTVSARAKRLPITNDNQLNFPGVYVYSYPAYSYPRPDGRSLFKIGMTEKTIHERVFSQRRKTEVPEDAIIFRAFPCQHPPGFEERFHQRLSAHRNVTKYGGTEWFWTTLDEIDSIFESMSNETFWMDAGSYERFMAGPLATPQTAIASPTSEIEPPPAFAPPPVRAQPREPQPTAASKATIPEPLASSPGPEELSVEEPAEEYRPRRARLD